MVSGQVKEASVQYQVSSHACDSGDSVESRACPLGYKQTEVGIIPEDWIVKKFIEVTDAITCGVAATPTYVSEQVGKPFLSAQNVRSGKVDYRKHKFITKALFQQITKHNKPCKSDILYTRVGAGIGEAGVVEDDYEFAIYVSLTLIKTKSNVANSHYICHLLNSDRYRFLAKNGQFAGGGVQNLNVDVVRNFPIPIPPIKEQIAIANALSDVDALITSLEKLIVKKRAIKTAAMQQLLTGKKRLPGFNGEWEVVKASDIGSFRGGCGFPVRYQGAATEELPFFKVSDMNNEGNSTFMETANNYISESVRKQLGAIVFPAESIIFAKVGAAVFLERKKILSRESCLDNNMAAFVMDVNRAYYRFIHYVLLNTKLGNFVSTTALPSLSGSVLSTIEIPLPPLLEQIAIASILSDMDKEIEALENRLNKTQQLKQGMMQELLTGRIRLV